MTLVTDNTPPATPDPAGLDPADPSPGRDPLPLSFKIAPAATPAPRPGLKLPAAAEVQVGPGLPDEAEFVLSALEAGNHNGISRRRLERMPYRACAALKLFSDDPQTPPWQIYVRDVNQQGLGFVTRHRLPLGYGGILTIETPRGRRVRIDCTLLRCRETVNGWFEGSMYFNREQGAFDPRTVGVELSR